MAAGARRTLGRPGWAWMTPALEALMQGREMQVEQRGERVMLTDQSWLTVVATLKV